MLQYQWYLGPETLFFGSLVPIGIFMVVASIVLCKLYSHDDHGFIVLYFGEWGTITKTLSTSKTNITTITATMTVPIAIAVAELFLVLSQLPQLINTDLPLLV